MGYLTRFNLEIIEGNDSTTDYKREISEIAGYYDLFFDEPCKWYDHHEDMIEYSKLHPKTLFKLEGIGEEYGDMWHEYFLNGKSQFVEVKFVFDGYDPSKLI